MNRKKCETLGCFRRVHPARELCLVCREAVERAVSPYRQIIRNIWWMARRYAHGRMTYAVGMYNEAIRSAQDLGMDFEPDPIDGLIEAKDGMFDREWFETREKAQ